MISTKANRRKSTDANKFLTPLQSRPFKQTTLTSPTSRRDSLPAKKQKYDWRDFADRGKARGRRGRGRGGRSNKKAQQSRSNSGNSNYVKDEPEEKVPEIDYSNAELSEAQEEVVSVVKAGESVFFTGSAGTGKSFLLNYLIHETDCDSTFVTASTGIAATHISGTTLHSFASVGLGTADVDTLVGKMRRPSKKRWKKCKKLIVDEVSMISGGFFDKLEEIARTVRNNQQPFGGIQLILCGDFLQLPPVSKKTKREKFCFEARSWENCVPKVVNLTHVFRQSNPVFVEMLSELRVGKLSQRTVKLLNQRKNANPEAIDGITPTKLYSHKKDVTAENMEKLALLPGPVRVFHCIDNGRNPHLNNLQKNCPAIKRVQLKIGAQVLLLKNLDPELGLVNGSRGKVDHYEKYRAEEDKNMTGPKERQLKQISSDLEFPVVKFTNGQERTMLPEKWDVELAGISVASRLQVPLMLAWSITIHKSQGMSLDNAEISLNSCFEYGQAYVALSRLRTLEGLCLLDMNVGVVKANPICVKFYEDHGFVPPRPSPRKHTPVTPVQARGSASAWSTTRVSPATKNPTWNSPSKTAPPSSRKIVTPLTSGSSLSTFSSPTTQPPSLSSTNGLNTSSRTAAHKTSPSKTISPQTAQALSRSPQKSSSPHSSTMTPTPNPVAQHPTFTSCTNQTPSSANRLNTSRTPQSNSPQKGFVQKQYLQTPQQSVALSSRFNASCSSTPSSVASRVSKAERAKMFDDEFEDEEAIMREMDLSMFEAPVKHTLQHSTSASNDATKATVSQTPGLKSSLPTTNAPHVRSGGDLTKTKRKGLASEAEMNTSSKIQKRNGLDVKSTNLGSEDTVAKIDISGSTQKPFMVALCSRHKKKCSGSWDGQSRTWKYSCLMGCVISCT